LSDVRGDMARHWIDGRLVDASEIARLAPSDDESCYTTARVSNGVPRHQRKHIERIQRDAARMGFGTIDAEAILNAFHQLSEAAFGRDEGVIRVRVVCSRETGDVRICADSRPLGSEPAVWHGIVAPFPHTGPDGWAGVKLMNRDLYARAHDYSAIAKVDETLLFDANGFLVEGSRSNILVVTSDGVLSTPDLVLGAVSGIAQDILREGVPEIATRAIRVHDVCDAREVIATNAVRGACAIVSLGEITIANGEPGPWCERLSRVLADDS
jgi:branched-subunit amino acid aminotransferase/4-amino-4-deoxychorismate lyase